MLREIQPYQSWTVELNLFANLSQAYFAVLQAGCDPGEYTNSQKGVFPHQWETQAPSEGELRCPRYQQSRQCEEIDILIATHVDINREIGPHLPLIAVIYIVSPAIPSILLDSSPLRPFIVASSGTLVRPLHTSLQVMLDTLPHILIPGWSIP